MKRAKRLSSLLLIVLSTWMLDACTFSFQVLTPAAAAEPPTTTSTSLPPTPIPASPTADSSAPATPTLISIRVDTLNMLEIYNSLDLDESVRSLAFTPDGSALAATGGDTEDFAIHIWDVASGQKLAILGGHTGIVWNVAFSPDGQMLASVSSDGTARVWDWRNGDTLKVLNFPDQVGSVSFSPNGQTLAVGGLDDLQNLRAAIWIFSASSWQPLLKIPETVNITAMSYSPNGRWLVGGGASRNVQIWRTSDGTSIFTLNHANQALDVAISPDSSIAATATCGFAVDEECTEGSVWLWDMETGKLVNRLSDFPDVVESVAFSADGSSLIAVSRDGTLRIYDTVNYEPQFVADPPGGNGVMALAPDSGLLATGGVNGDVRLWKVVYRP